MLKRLVLVSLLFVAASTFAQTAAPQPQFLRMVQHVAGQYMQRHQAPGVAIALYYQGQPYYINLGVANRMTNVPVTSNTLFEIGSITKVFTASLLGLEINAGKVALNTPAVDYLPPEVSRFGGPIRQVTLEQLAIFTSSLPRTLPAAQASEAGVMNFLSTWQPKYPIGTQPLYSNLGYGVLGYALEGLMHQSYWQLLVTNILQPLGMSSTYLRVPASQSSRFAQGYKGNQAYVAAPHWFVPGWPAAGQLRSSTKDMMAFLLANMDIGNPPPALAKAMQTAQQPYGHTRHGRDQGFAWVIGNYKGVTIVQKDGSTAGFASYIAFAPAQKMGIVILSNLDKSPVRLGRWILIHLAQQQAAPTQTSTTG